MKRIFSRIVAALVTICLTQSLALSLAISLFPKCDVLAEGTENMSNLTEENEISYLEDSIEIEEAKEIDSTTDYILNNINPAYAQALKLEEHDAILTKQTFVDYNIMPKDNMTFEGLWYSDFDEIGVPFITQNQNNTMMYNTDDESEYFVAFINPMINDSNIKTVDVAFAKNNLNGEEYKDCIYDDKTGLAYIPKKYTVDSGLMFQSACQLLQAVNSPKEKTSVDLEIEVESKDDVKQIESQGVGYGDILDFTTTVKITDDLSLLDGIKEDDIDIYVDGISFPFENAGIDLKEATVTIPLAPTNINSVRIEIEGKTFFEKTWERIKGLFSPLKVEAATGSRWYTAVPKDGGTPYPITVLPFTFKYKNGSFTDMLPKGGSFEWNATSVPGMQYIDYQNPADRGEHHSTQTDPYVYMPMIPNDGSATSPTADNYEWDYSLMEFIWNGGHLAIDNLRPTQNQYFMIKMPPQFTMTNQTNGKSVDITIEPDQSDPYWSDYYKDGVYLFPMNCAHITSPIGSVWLENQGFAGNPDDPGRILMRCVDYQMDENGYGEMILAYMGQGDGKDLGEYKSESAGKQQSAFGVGVLRFQAEQGKIRLTKSSLMPTITNGNKKYNFNGIQYGVYKDASCSQLVTTATFDANGQTPEMTLDVGQYYIKEINANAANTGYKISNRVYPVSVIAGTETTTLNVQDEPIEAPISLKLKKIDPYTKDGTPQGNATLQGAEYTVKYYDVDLSTDPAKSGHSPIRTWVMKTDSNGHFTFNDTVEKVKSYKVSGDDFYVNSDGKVTFPLGTVTLQETKAPGGYLINEEVYVVPIKNNGVNSVTTPSLPSNGISQEELPITGGLKITKIDKELSKSEAIGGKDHTASEFGATLEDIEFTIYNANGKTIAIKDKEFPSQKEIMKIKTKWSDEDNAYVAKTDVDALPFGTYTVRETKSNSGYLLNNAEEFTFRIENNNTLVSMDASGKDIVFKNQIKRRDIEGEKVEDSSLKRMSVAFLVTNKATGEKHVVVSDENGEIDTNSAWNQHSYMTNDNDRLLSYVENDERIPTSEINTESGVWFGKGEDENVSHPDDSLGAFPYGTYTLEELACEENEGHELICILFSISRDSNTRALDLSTLTNDFIMEPKDDITDEEEVETPAEIKEIEKTPNPEPEILEEEPEPVEEEPEPEVVEEEKEPDEEIGVDTGKTSPPTGDDSSVILALLIMIMSAISLRLFKDSKGY